MIPKSDGYMFVIDFVPGGLDLNLISPHDHPNHYGSNVACVRVYWDDIDGQGVTEGTFRIENLPKQLEQFAADLFAMYLVKRYYPEDLQLPGGNK